MARIARSASPATIRKAIRDHSAASDSVERLLADLEANQIDLDRTPITLGPTLTFDETKERFVDQHAEWANMYLKRNYREPYVVPEVV